MLNPQEGIKRYPKLLDCLRYFCAFMLYMYGVSKLAHLQFNMPDLSKQTVGSLNGYQLTWFYYGYSRIYACILGATQVAGATLLLFRRTTLLGAFIMLPVMVNILLINMFILVDDYGPYFISILICSSLVLILWNQRIAFFSLFWATQTAELAGPNRAHRWIRLFIVLAVAMIMISVALMHHFVRR